VTTEPGRRRQERGRWSANEAVIGIEIHCQLKTPAKMFCGCSTAIDGAAPNSHCCPVCLGLPGVLPTINKAAVEYVIATGLRIEAAVRPHDPLGSQELFLSGTCPRATRSASTSCPWPPNGRPHLRHERGPFTVRVRRAHLEEDTGRLIHDELGGGGSA